MKTFSEASRYDYPLDAESVVFDCGAYEGDFARAIAHRYGCRVFAFEPCRRFFEIARATVKAFPNVVVYNFAVGGSTRDAELAVRGDSTSLHSKSHETQTVRVFALGQLLGIVDSPPVVDLMKLNVEGAEYEILEHAIEAGILTRFKNIQVQWHGNVEYPASRRAKIVDELLKTHDHTWGDDPSFHQNFQLR